MDSLELIASIEAYKTQLDQINNVLESASEENKPKLQTLQLDLIQLLELTLQQLEEGQRDLVTTPTLAKSEEDKRLEDELALFKSEIAELTGEDDTSATSTTNNFSEETKRNITIPSIETTMKDLRAIEGQEVRAPYTERWGGHTHHNAVILSIVTNEEGLADLDDPKVLVLFSQPTNVAMLPCPFFLNGKCKFISEKCKFSHGTEVALSELEDYVEPDQNLITAGSLVLAKHKEDIWHRGTVCDVLEDRSSYSFTCEVCKDVVEVKPDSVVPLQQQEDQTKIHGVDYTNCQLDNVEVSKNSQTDENVVFTPHTLGMPNLNNSKLGQWELYTNGIGSKLMGLMGYIEGTGLGAKSDGRVEPVTSLVYPQGVSLDRCMALRLASGGKNLLAVEKHLQKEQKKEEQRQKRQSEGLLSNASVFNLINERLSIHGSKIEACSSETKKQKIDVSKTSLNKDSTKDLNKKNMLLGSHINIITSEINKLQKSKERNSSDQVTLNMLDKRLQEKQSKLSSLKNAEKKIQKEQQTRKDTKKMCIF